MGDILRELSRTLATVGYSGYVIDEKHLVRFFAHGIKSEILTQEEGEERLLIAKKKAERFIREINKYFDEKEG